jgi:nucleotide-binding universal stress UspA family protein
MKNILLLLHDDPGQEARLQAALDLTRALEGHLTCLDVTLYPFPGGYFDADAQVALLEDERLRETVNLDRVKERLAVEDVPWTVSTRTGELADCVIAAAGLADLIVVNRQLETGEAVGMLSVTSNIALKARKPVVAVGQGCRGFDAGGHAVVAWDGSEPAMVAVSVAVPLLALAKSVNVVEIQSDKPGTAQEAATYLSRHGVRAEVDLVARFKEDGGDTADLIKQICAAQDAAYCVMGAYGHSSLREALFGGVTRKMLTSSDVPLVLAH